MEGYISSHFYNIQRFHLAMPSNYLNGADWTKQFISKILQLTHSQWIYHNISLNNKCHGYLQNKQLERLLQTIAELSNLSPEEVPNNSRFVLGFKFTELTKAHLEMQRYWTLAVNVALTTRQDKQQQGACIKQVWHKLNRKISSWKKLGIAEQLNTRSGSMACTAIQTPPSTTISPTPNKQP